MVGFEETLEQSAEICICEIFGSHVAGGTSTVGYGIHPFNDPVITDEFHQDAIKVNAADCHIYAAEWMPAYVEFFIDNVKSRTVRQSPNYPMQFMLGIYEIPDQLTSPSSRNFWPKTRDVDYVRGYQPIAGYEKSQGFA
jgi:hypothetical protein